MNTKKLIYSEKRASKITFYAVSAIIALFTILGLCSCEEDYDIEHCGLNGENIIDTPDLYVTSDDIPIENLHFYCKSGIHSHVSRQFVNEVLENYPGYRPIKTAYFNDKLDLASVYTLINEVRSQMERFGNNPEALNNPIIINAIKEKYPIVDQIMNNTDLSIGVFLCAKLGVINPDNGKLTIAYNDQSFTASPDSWGYGLTLNNDSILVENKNVKVFQYSFWAEDSGHSVIETFDKFIITFDMVAQKDENEVVRPKVISAHCSRAMENGYNAHLLLIGEDSYTPDATPDVLLKLVSLK